MNQKSICVWFVCRLCRGSFRQVDAFIEHKKQKHFTQFQNTTCIVFEETEHSEMCPVIIKAENELVDENIELLIKLEVSSRDIIAPFSSELIEEPNLALVEPKSELITYESEINPGNENNFFDVKQPEQNPYVLLKRLTSEEIQSASVTNISTKDDLQFECNLCSKQLQSEPQLKIHVGICALYHEDQSRFCVPCNRKLCDTKRFKDHLLRFHGTKEQKLSLYKFKCHLCPREYRNSTQLKLHLESHKKQEQVKASNSKLSKCSHPNCGKEFVNNSGLRRHRATHSDYRPFSCPFPNCKKKFYQRGNLNIHLRTHTGERPFKCTVNNCNKAFTKSYNRSLHYRSVHSNLFTE